MIGPGEVTFTRHDKRSIGRRLKKRINEANDISKILFKFI
jgi:hypothetical protein